MLVNDMTRKDFEALPHREWNDDIGTFHSMVILPGRIKNMHDSGYRTMDFVATKDGKAICRLSGCSDVIHIEGIGGMGKYVMNSNMGNGYWLGDLSHGWSIDCLPKSGLLQLFPGSGSMTVGTALSSFEVFGEPKEKI